MAVQQARREQPESDGKSRKDRPEMPGERHSTPELTGRGKPGTMPENPANVDREHEPAGIDPSVDRSKDPNRQKRGSK